jgi:hypothetical protein
MEASIAVQVKPVDEFHLGHDTLKGTTQNPGGILFPFKDWNWWTEFHDLFLEPEWCPQGELQCKDREKEGEKDTANAIATLPLSCFCNNPLANTHTQD